MSFMLGEAFVLGLVSGPACIASCGPVLVPSLLSERQGLRLNARYLCAFLSTRFAGYMVFALIAWQLGTMASLAMSRRSLVFGVIDVLLAVALIWYAASAGDSCQRACAATELVTIGVPHRRGVPGAAVLGFFTGVSLCPPFLAAGVRAAALGSVVSALFFFAAFFLGTSMWFVPFVGFSCIRRNDAVVTVARMAMVLIACYYGFEGLTMLAGGKIHG